MVGTQAGSGPVSTGPDVSANGRMTVAERELIDTGTGDRFIRGDERGRFKAAGDVLRSPLTERRREAHHGWPGQDELDDRNG